MDSISRRNFLKSAAVAGTILNLPGCASRAVSQTSLKPAEKKPIRYRTLGSTGWKVSEIGFGSMNMRDPELVRAALDAGINYIDTAHDYMNGVNEEVIGSVISGYRDKIFLTTKLPKQEDPVLLEKAMGESLKRLRVDYVDCIQIHSSTTTQVRSQYYMDQFAKIREKGLARYVGISSHGNMGGIVNAMVETKFWEIATISYNYTCEKSVTTNINKARAAGLGIVAMKTLDMGKGYSTAATESMTPIQAALKWALQNPNVDTAIPGMTSLDHIGEDMAVMSMELSSSDRETLRLYGESLNGRFCRGIQGCTGCLNQCPYGVDIHEINRCLGYVYGYGDLRLARENYDRLPAHSHTDVCSNCDTCKVRCVNGLDLNENIGKARVLFG